MGIFIERASRSIIKDLAQEHTKSNSEDPSSPGAVAKKALAKGVPLRTARILVGLALDKEAKQTAASVADSGRQRKETTRRVKILLHGLEK